MPLKTLLRRLIWASMVPLFLLVTAIASHRVITAYDLLKREASSLSESISFSIDAEIKVIVSSLVTLAESPLLDNVSKLDEFYSLATAFKRNLGLHVILSDSKATVMLLNTRVPFGEKLPPLPRPKGNAAALQAIQKLKPAVGDLFHGPVVQKPLLAVAVPVVRNGDLKYVLLSLIPADHYQSILDRFTIPNTWTVIIKDGIGGEIAKRNASDTADNQSGNFLEAEKFNAPLSNANWQVEIDIPAEIYFLPLFKTGVGLLALVLLGLIGGQFVGNWASRGLARSISSLLETQNGKNTDSPDNNDFSRDALEIAEIRARLTEARALHDQAEMQLRRHAEELEQAMLGTLHAISNMMERRDPYTAGHERRVGKIASAIAREMGQSDDYALEMELAGAIHDIGKIRIPAEILAKPTKLTDEEFALIKTHPREGYEILKDVNFSWPVAKIILQHHERFDGSGYPSGLKGDEIMMEARILMVADVIEAMASHRPYRASLGIEFALSEIEKNKGRYYDHEVANAALNLFRNKHYVIE